MSIQKEEVSAVSAPSALGNKAEINPTKKMIVTKMGKPLCTAMVGNKASPLAKIPCLAA